VNPGAAEVANAADDDCNGYTDELVTAHQNQPTSAHENLATL
jgi:hypothetical protein